MPNFPQPDLPEVERFPGFVEIQGGHGGGVVDTRVPQNPHLPGMPGSEMARRFGAPSPYSSIPMRYNVGVRDVPPPRPVGQRPVAVPRPAMPRQVAAPRPTVRQSATLPRVTIRGGAPLTPAQLGIRDPQNFHGRGIGLGGVTTTGNWNSGVKHSGLLSPPVKDYGVVNRWSVDQRGAWMDPVEGGDNAMHAIISAALAANPERFLGTPMMRNIMAKSSPYKK